MSWPDFTETETVNSLGQFQWKIKKSSMKSGHKKTKVSMFLQYLGLTVLKLFFKSSLPTLIIIMRGRDNKFEFPLRGADVLQKLNLEEQMCIEYNAFNTMHIIQCILYNAYNTMHIIQCL